MAELVGYLVSDRAAYFTDECIFVNREEGSNPQFFPIHDGKDKNRINLAYDF